MEYSFKKINDKNIEITEMKDNTFSNIDTINELVYELEKLSLDNDEVADIEERHDKKENSKEVVFSKDSNEIDNPLLEEINYYYLRIKDFDLVNNEESIKLLKKELPSKKNGNYKNIILGINTFLIKEINEIRNFLESEKVNLSKEELEDFKKDINDTQNKINAILQISFNHQPDKENNLEINEPLNNIVFLETESGNIYALEDLDNNSVPNEYYEGFYELIHSIEDGTFKNVKYLTSANNKTAGISEVKGFKKRVIFDRVGYNTYAIIGVFTKKSDKDKSYLEPLKNRIAIYRKNRDYIVKKINQEEGYLDSQRKILEEIYKLLKPNTRKRGWVIWI